MFEFNKNNVKKILLIITYTILLCFALLNFNVVLNGLGYVFKLIKPFIFGFCIAFILNIPLSKIESIIKNHRRKKLQEKNAKLKRKIDLRKADVIGTKTRLVTIILSLMIFIGIILLTLFLVIPQFVETVSIFKESIPKAFNTAKDWAIELVNNNPDKVQKIKEFTPNWQELDANITDFVKNAATGIIGFSIEFVIGVFSGIVNFFMGVIFAVYMLSQKEKLIEQAKKLCRAYIPEDKCNKLLHVGSITNDVFKKFFGGQFIEAMLLGTLCFIGMTIFRMPYALTIAVLIGVTALIPVFGAFIGTGIGAILILAVDPMQALWFVILILVIQQIDNNVFYPKIVGDSVGLPAIWVMLAVLVGGNSLGVIGMLIGVPVASVVYKLVKERVDKSKELDAQK